MNNNYKENNLYDYDIELEYLFSLQSNYCIYYQFNLKGNLVAIWKIKFKIIKSN